MPLDRLNEQGLSKLGCKYIVGCDEAGRGPLIGPVVCAGVLLPKDLNLNLLKDVFDSKQLDESERNSNFDVIRGIPGLVYAVEIMDEICIDTCNILQTSLLGMTRCAMRIASLCDNEGYIPSSRSAIEAPPWPKVDHPLDDLTLSNITLKNKLGVIYDGPYILKMVKDNNLTNVTGKGVVKGDATELSIACASILAKVVRDKIMRDFALNQSDDWEFHSNKGYPSPAHLECLTRMKPLPEHRWSYGPVIDAMIRNKLAPSYIVEKEYKPYFLMCRKGARALHLDQVGKEHELYGYIKMEIERFIAHEKQQKAKPKKIIGNNQTLLNFVKISEKNKEDVDHQARKRMNIEDDDNEQVLEMPLKKRKTTSTTYVTCDNNNVTI